MPRESSSLRILFVCARNSCRSPMAEGFARAHGLGLVEARSTAWTPRGRIDPMAVRAMRERGIDIRDLWSKAIRQQLVDWAELVVVLSGEDERLGPLPPTKRVENWRVEDPLGWPLDIYEDVRDEIEEHVIELLQRVSSLRAAPVVAPLQDAIAAA